MSVPTVIKVLSSLAVILIVSQITRKLLLSIIVGTILLAVWTGHSSTSMWETVLGNTLSSSTLMLILVIFQVIWLSSQMARAGIMEELVVAIRERVSHRMSIAVLPAVIGLLPMPGGAIFSAPLVDSCDTEGNLSPELKTRINFWFRHVWEYWWPLYPGILLAVEICRVSLWQIMIIQFPITLFTIIVGYFWFLRLVPHEKNENNKPSTDPTTKLLPLVLPILIIVGTYALVVLGHSILQKFTGDFEMNKYLPMCIGLFAAMFVLNKERPLDFNVWKKIILSKKAFVFAGIVFAVRIYGGFLSAKLPNGELVVEQMRAEMFDWGFPVLAAVIILPFICGLTTGITVGFVGASFPIVVTLIGAGTNVSSSYFLGTIAVAYCAGYAGVLLSPVHVCMIVTSEHFKTKLMNNIAVLAIPVGVVFLATLLWRYVIIAIGN